MHEDWMQRPEIAELDVSAFSRRDLLNIVLQRSQVLWDVPRAGRVIRAWVNGNSAPIESQVDRLGPEIARRAAAMIFEEHAGLLPVLSKRTVARVADIGCGYGFWDLAMHRSHDCAVLLIDIEDNDVRHFGFAEDAAAYTSLDVARQFLTDNGILKDRIETLNPTTQDLLATDDVDLAVSFLSCGFHYPVDGYLDFFKERLASDGAMILDLREKSAEPAKRKLAEIGDVSVLQSSGKCSRVLISK